MKKNLLFSFMILILVGFINACAGKNGKNGDPGVGKKNSPNIILILTDDQGWTHTSHRADPKIPKSKSDFYETPNMDKLAKSGILFTQGYAPNPICSPSRNSLMFGQNTARHLYNQDADWYKKTSGWFTIPRVIKMADSNYRTAHFGKWHIAMHPRDAGFDYEEGMTSNGAGDIFADGYLDAKDYIESSNKYLEDNNISNPTKARKVSKPTAYWSDKNPKGIFSMTARAKQFMKESIDEDKPFYVQLSHYATHLALVSQKETYDYFKKKKPGERHTNPEFAAMLKDLDSGVGIIMDFIKEQKIENNTYIFLMGDNGGKLSLNQVAIIGKDRSLLEARYSTLHNRNLPLRDGKHSYYEGGLRVPFIVVGPGIHKNRISETPVTGLDFLPTFARLAGFDKSFPEEIDGGDLRPLLFDEKVNKIERNSEYLIFHQGSDRTPKSAIRKDDFKLVKYWSKDTKNKNTQKVELFDLKNDLGEKIDLIKTNPEVARDLEKALDDFLSRVKGETNKRDIRDAFYRLKDELGEKGEESDD